jgi:hypothetical protein
MYFRYFNISMYILALVDRYTIYIYDLAVVVSIRVDNILLKTVVLTETCKGWKIKNTTFISHTERWLKILYTISVINFASCINEAILCTRNHDLHRIDEEFMSSRDERIKVNVVPTLYTSIPYMKIQSLVQFNS